MNDHVFLCLGFFSVVLDLFLTSCSDTPSLPMFLLDPDVQLPYVENPFFCTQFIPYLLAHINCR